MKCIRGSISPMNLKTLERLPLVEIAGEKRVLIENHQGVVSYCTEEIQIKVCYGAVSIVGQGLRFMQLNRDQLVITGQLDHISLLRR